MPTEMSCEGATNVPRPPAADRGGGMTGAPDFGDEPVSDQELAWHRAVLERCREDAVVTAVEAALCELEPRPVNRRLSTGVESPAGYGHDPPRSTTQKGDRPCPGRGSRINPFPSRSEQLPSWRASSKS
jgi:hypothetical protein